MIRGKKIIKYIKLSRLRHKEKLSKFKEFKINYGYISKNAMELNILNNEGTFHELSSLTCVPGKHKSIKLVIKRICRGPNI